jgi:UDP-N-acetylglucosamine 2-epimerase (non-hydrolysing)
LASAIRVSEIKLKLLKKIKVLSVFGTRPEAIKMAPVVLALENSNLLESRVCVTGQHREMLDQVLSLFELKPQEDLNLMQPNQQLANLTAEVLTNLDPILTSYEPDWVLVQGDTTTAYSAALTAFYRHIKVGHVEAGLRTFDKWQPFPEEVNRRMISVVSDLHFAPTGWSRQNLINEGVPENKIVVTGNTVVDALQMIIDRPEPAEIKQLAKEAGLNRGNRLVLVTAHRRENLGQPLNDVCRAIKILVSKLGTDIQFVYPVHRNPKVREPVFRILGKLDSVHLLDPLDYLPLVHVLKRASLVLTDSGGIQEEAVSLGIPTLVLREKTERPEGLDSGILKLVGTNTERIVEETTRFLSQSARVTNKEHINPFGDGKAAQRIVESILGYSENE